MANYLAVLVADAAAFAFLAFLACFTFLAGLAVELDAVAAGVAAAGTGSAGGVAAKERAATLDKTAAAITDLMLNMVFSFTNRQSL
jgi:hypothetical protein